MFVETAPLIFEKSQRKEAGWRWIKAYRLSKEKKRINSCPVKL